MGPELWSALFDAVGGDGEVRGRWRVAIDEVLESDSADALVQWSEAHAAGFDGALIAALWDVAGGLVDDDSVDALPRLMRLDRLILLVNLQAMENPDFPHELLLHVLQYVEVAGCGPGGPGDDSAKALMRAFNYRGCVLADAERFRPALEHFTACLTLDPGFAPAYCNRIRMHLELGDGPAVDADSAALQSVDPAYPVGIATVGLVEAMRRIARYHDGSESPAEIAAEHGLLDYLRIYDRPMRPSELGRTLAELPDPFTIEPLPADPTVEDLNHHGVVLGRSGRLDEAVAALTAGIALDPTYDRLFFNRGNAHRLAQHYEEALADFGEYIGRGPPPIRRGLR
jgi:tetratricopeptide (TPR) repeat protein